jgi:uncharacterized protein YggE
MRTKTTLVIAIVLASILLSACAGGIASAQPALAQAPSTEQPQPRTISVSGNGKAYLTPDIVHIYIGVHTENKVASTAVDDNNAQSSKVASALSAFKIDPKDIQTTNFSIYPQQQVDNNGKPTGIIYMVDNTVYVTLRDLTKLGDLLDAVVKAGANNISSIQFDVADQEAALSDARKQAVDNARKQAAELAQAAGVTLGDIQTLSTSTSGVPMPVFEGKGGGAGQLAASVPVSAGQMVVSVDVYIVYLIK